MKVKLLGAAAAACLVAAPPLALSQTTPAGKVSAVDKPAPAWSPANLTITAGQSVTFESTGNTQKHYLAFRDAKPTCDSGVATSFPPSANWSGTCTFSTPGDYSFYCPLHDIPPYSTMRGTIHVVAAPVDTPTPDSTITPGASPTPTPDRLPRPDRRDADPADQAHLQARGQPEGPARTRCDHGRPGRLAARGHDHALRTPRRSLDEEPPRRPAPSRSASGSARHRGR